MSSNLLKAVFLCLPLLGAGCGFTPMYGEDREAASALPLIKIATIPDRRGQILHNYLLDLLSPKGAPKRSAYTLETDLDIHTRDIGIRRDETANRKQVTVRATITLKDSQTFGVLHKRTITTFNSYTLQAHDYFAVEVGEEAAIKEALHLTAQKIKLDLSAFLLHHHP